MKKKVLEFFQMADIFQFSKLVFHLKALQTRMLIYENNFFVAQVVLEIYAKKNNFQNLLDVFFYYSL